MDERESQMQSTPLSPSLGRRLTALFVAFILTIQTLPAFAGVYYIHSDHLDTPRVVTNQQNQIVWQNPPLSEPFGSGAPDEDPDGDATPFTLNLRFPGQYFDPETNAHYNYYRDHYFPSLGRYGQSDPIGLLGGINTYGYVEGNPLRYSDPSGLVNHHTGQTFDCGNGCTIHIDFTFDQKTGKKTRHLHWNCKGKKGACGESGGESHSGSWDDAPRNVQECAKNHGFHGQSSLSTHEQLWLEALRAILNARDNPWWQDISSNADRESAMDEFSGDKKPSPPRGPFPVPFPIPGSPAVIP
jgi:RHS repeat-associated protein